MHDLALPLAQDYLDGEIDVQTAVDELLSALVGYLDPDSQLCITIQTLAPQVVAAILDILSNLGVTIGKRK
ncbi:unnamed protein product [Adineta steineri]|uniref:Uncharacterized protein n=1 Tax=Adineta steineri TaxID=433720 RepID=A0A818UFM9_9BILA|nr:unnamed protein product [Adineta steineri]CAF3697802.1 unnamed protein product [Adineta steineri]